MMAKLPKELLEKGVICSSAGNHAQGVALAAKRLNCSAVIAMPVTTPEIKVDFIIVSFVTTLGYVARINLKDQVKCFHLIFPPSSEFSGDLLRGWVPKLFSLVTLMMRHKHMLRNVQKRRVVHSYLLLIILMS